MTEILIPVILVSVVGLVASVILSFASKVFAVQEDPLFLELRAELPGANCGACGFAGCDDYAHAMTDNKETPCTKCSVGGASVAEKLGALLGKDASGVAKQVAFVMCNGTSENAKGLYDYEGIASCKAAKTLFGGAKSCPFGCLGLGDCMAVCDFNAMHLVNGVALVNRDLCTSCGRCVSACPQSLIRILPEKSLVSVRCHNTQKGGEARKNCTVACIGCKKCEAVCKFDAIHVTDFLSEIDPDKCKNCGLCAKECPTGAIRNLRELMK